MVEFTIERPWGSDPKTLEEKYPETYEDFNMFTDGEKIKVPLHEMSDLVSLVKSLGCGIVFSEYNTITIYDDYLE